MNSDLIKIAAIVIPVLSGILSSYIGIRDTIHEYSTRLSKQDQQISEINKDLNEIQQTVTDHEYWIKDFAARVPRHQ